MNVHRVTQATPGARFTKVLKRLRTRKGSSKMSNLMITELFKHILLIWPRFPSSRSARRGSRRIRFTTFRYRWTENGTGPKRFRNFQETGPWTIKIHVEKRSQFTIAHLNNLGQQKTRDLMKINCIRSVHSSTCYKYINRSSTDS